MGDVHYKQAGCCTRCGEPFTGTRATAYIVAETVAWSRAWEHAGFAAPRREIVPVCAPCVTPEEEAEATHEVACAGCGQAMRSRLKFLRVCSNRCYQRDLRGSAGLGRGAGAKSAASPSSRSAPTPRRPAISGLIACVSDHRREHLSRSPRFLIGSLPACLPADGWRAARNS
jgi:hypothetical protein